MPHTHAEDRIYTVMSGVFYIGLGDTFDAMKLTAYGPGSVIVLPGNTSHFHWARSGEYVTQVTAIGPLGLTYVNQVVSNLLSNAAAAMSGIEDRLRIVCIRTERDAEAGACLTVRDTGVGFDLPNVERLFEAFYTTKRTGMGIGLSICRSIVESHNGRIWAAPNDGPGACFAFSIPKAPGAAASPILWSSRYQHLMRGNRL